MQKKQERAHDLAEEGLDKVIAGEEDKGRAMIEEAKKIDPRAVEQLAEEIESDKAAAGRFVGKQKETPEAGRRDRQTESGERQKSSA